MNNEFKDIREFKDIIALKAKDPERFERYQKIARKHTEKSYLPKKAILKFHEALQKTITKIINSDIEDHKKRTEILSIITTSLAILFSNIPDEDIAVAIRTFLENKKGIENFYKEFML